MKITIRPYRGGDEANIVSLWNRVLTHDLLDAPTFYQKFLLDPNFDPNGTLVAADHDHVIGFIQAMLRKVPLGSDLEPDTGWITALAVDPAYRRRGVASQLLGRAEGWLKENGHHHVEFSSYAPSYVVPGIDEAGYPGATAFFAAQGYRTLYPCVAMDRSLVDYVMPDDVRQLVARRESEGVTFEAITPPYYVPLLQFCEREFYGDWTRAIREALIRNVPPSQIRICREATTILGFTVFGAYDRSFDRFGPFGVAESQRGRGLGKALLHLTLQEQQRQHCHASWFLWTGEKSAAGHLYRAAGFTVFRRFTIVTKVLR